VNKDFVTLALLKVDDAAEMFDIVERNRDHFRSFLTWIDGCTDVSHIASSIADSIKQGSHRYGIFYKGQLVGTINFHGTDKSNMSDGVGYWLDAAHQGNGIMTAATHQLLAIGFGQLGLNTIRIKCAVDNLASRGIPERLGFTLEGVLRQNQYLNGQYVDMALYSLLASEFPASLVK